MQINLHQPHINIADFQLIQEYLFNSFNKSNQKELHLYPELMTSGYPLQDLVLQLSFIKQHEQLMDSLRNHLRKKPLPENCAHLFGGLEYEMNEGNNLPHKIRNVIYCAQNDEIKVLYAKRLLPNYDIFDEQKYYTAGTSPEIFKFNDLKIGLLICEDMWASGFHQIDPVTDLYNFCQQKNHQLDMVLNLSASPYTRDKFESRLKRAQEISTKFQAPFYYVNRVGAEDEILFDGRSFAVAGEQLLGKAALYEADILKLALKKYNITASKVDETINYSSWEGQFRTKLDKTKSPPVIAPWSDEYCHEVIKSLCFGLQEYAQKSGFKKFLVALSGGMDSALVLALTKLSLKDGQELEAIYMPSQYSSSLSWELSFDLCQKLQIPLKSFPIKFLHSAAKNAFREHYSELTGLADENIQSRLRGMLLYTRSNQTGSMVINTSNKSEIAVGYSTQYGDSVGAVSMLGDLFKSEIYQLAEYINRAFNGLIPEGIITREPSAELREGQIDSQSLPPYDILDAILEGILSFQYDKDSLIKLGFESETVEKVFNLYRKTEYKRYQFCPIIKIKAKSFGFGYRIPLSKCSDFYLNS